MERLNCLTLFVETGKRFKLSSRDSSSDCHGRENEPYEDDATLKEDETVSTHVKMKQD